MRLALPGSALVHGGIVAALLAGFAWPMSEDAPPGQPVTVDIVSLSAVSANETETVEGDAAQTLVSSGAEAIAPSPPPVIEPLVAEAPTPPQVLEPLPARAAEPVAAAEAPVLTELASLMPSAVAALAPVETVTPEPPPETIAPVSEAELKQAPVPQTLTIARRSEPTYPERPRQQEQAQPQPERQATPAGNGGNNDADAVAAGGSAPPGNAGNGGEAEVARYPGQVLSRLKRALRYPRDAGGASGEVMVEFTVLADGSAGGIRVVGGSGNQAIDMAGLATVSRAAPFPPIPPAANRSNWTFTVPLAFQR